MSKGSSSQGLTAVRLSFRQMSELTALCKLAYQDGCSSFVLVCTGRRKILNTKLLHYVNTEDNKGKATEEFYSTDLKQKNSKGK